MKNIKSYFLDVFRITSILFISIALILWIVFAAWKTISNSSEIVEEWDIITASWYNDIKSKFDLIWSVFSWPHTEWWLCSYSNNKIMCNNSLPEPVNSEVQQLYSAAYTSHWWTEEERIKDWNDSVTLTAEAYSNLRVGSPSWEEFCTINPDWSFTLVDWMTKQDQADSCMRWICTRASDYIYNLDFKMSDWEHCAEWGEACPKWLFFIACLWTKKQ